MCIRDRNKISRFLTAKENSFFPTAFTIPGSEPNLMDWAHYMTPRAPFGCPSRACNTIAQLHCDHSNIFGFSFASFMNSCTAETKRRKLEVKPKRAITHKLKDKLDSRKDNRVKLPINKERLPTVNQPTLATP